MKLTLKRIPFDKYDELLSEFDPETFFEKKDEIQRKVESCSEVVYLNGKEATIDINIEEYKSVAEEYSKKGEKGEASVRIAQLLHRDFRIGGEKLPNSLMYEKEFWAYLNLTIFFDLVKTKYINEGSDSNTLLKKIERCYFNNESLSKIDRTGLRFLWVLADLTEDNGSYELTKIAWDFIDPFKAIQECVLGTNPMILKAFAKAIKKMDCDSRIKNSNYRTLVPKHIRNYACSHFFDGYETPDELANLLVDQISIILSAG